MTDDEMIEEYLHAVLDAFKEKALEYHATAGDTKTRFERTTRIKNALKEIGKVDALGNDNFSIAAGEYSHCPSGVCNGQVCTARLSFGGEDELRDLAQKLGVANM